MPEKINIEKYLESRKVEMYICVHEARNTNKIS